MKRTIIWYSLIIIMAGCSQTPRELPPQEYVKWIGGYDHGLVKTKQVNDVTIQVRYLPAEYLAYREFSQSQDIAYDSVLQSHKCGLVFQLTLQADAHHSRYSNLMHYDLSSHEELMARTRYLSFQIDDFVSLHHQDVDHLPVLSVFEGYDAVGNKLTFQVVFELQEFNCGVVKEEFNDVRLTFDDPLWGLGTNHFMFEKKIFEEIPKIKL